MNEQSESEVLFTHTPALFRSAVQRAVTLLRAGEVVALPTETVYGLAANALEPEAVARIYEVKGRPPHNPIIVHVVGMNMAKRCAIWKASADKLVHAFWPGPLTIVLPHTPVIPDIVTAGGSTVGIRWPSHPFMQAVIRECGFPLAAPSANLSTRLSPTHADHVLSQLGERIRLIVDGGPSHVGIESTVVDVTTDPPRLLRPGMIHEQALVAVTGALTLGAESTEHTLKSPGLLKKHYAPRARLRVLSWQNDPDLMRQLASQSIDPGSVHLVAHTHIPAVRDLADISVVPHDPEAFARALYAELHRCDSAGAKVIVMEAVPDEPGWRAISDRLSRATA